MTTQIVVAFAFGLILVSTVLVLAVRFPNPTPFQYNVFRTVLSLAAAGVAAMIPGFINIEWDTTGLLIRAGGTLAIFVIVFFFNPAMLPAAEARNDLTEGASDPHKDSDRSTIKDAARGQVSDRAPKKDLAQPQASARASDIFLSYASEDRERVRPLVERLEEHGWSVWWDPKIPVSKTFPRVIEEALAAASAVLVVWSKASVKSEWVDIEAAKGRQRGVLVPVRLDEVDLPLEFSRMQTADLTEWDGSSSHSELQATFSALEAILSASIPTEISKPEVRKAPHHRLPWFRRRSLQVAGALVALGAVAVWSIPQFSSSLDPIRDCPECPLMVLIRGDTFSMGSPEGDTLARDNEHPARILTVPDFWMGVYEVTFGEWTAFRAADPDAAEGCGLADDHPVTCVSWNQAQAYTAWLGRETRRPFRLPTEAEWEYAARGGTTTPWFWGDDEGDRCRYANSVDNCGDDTYDGTSPVGSFQANLLGLHDTAGNVWEWVEDCWHDDYGGAPDDGSAWTERCSSGSRRVLRGGSFDDNPRLLRAASRLVGPPGARRGPIGFRVVWQPGGGQGLTLAPWTAPDGTEGFPYSQTLAATGGDGRYTWAMSSATTLPAGLTLETATGAISGTPTATGTTNFEVEVTSAGQTATKTLAITIAATALPPPSITTTSMAGGTVGTAYSQTLAATGGDGSYTWAMSSATTLPAGLTLDTATGNISGTPTAAGTTSFIVEVTSAAQTATKALAITVTALGIPMHLSSVPGLPAKSRSPSARSSESRVALRTSIELRRSAGCGTVFSPPFSGSLRILGLMAGSLEEA